MAQSQLTTQSKALDPCLVSPEKVVGILHWRDTSDRPLNCLFRFLRNADKPIVVLSELRSSREGTLFGYSPLPAIEAAYHAICSIEPIDASIVQWLIHSGPFGTYDFLVHADVVEFLWVRPIWNGRSFEEEPDYGSYEGVPYGTPLDNTLGLAPVEVVLDRLNWANGRAHDE